MITWERYSLKRGRPDPEGLDGPDSEGTTAWVAEVSDCELIIRRDKGEDGWNWDWTLNCEELALVSEWLCSGHDNVTEVHAQPIALQVALKMATRRAGALFAAIFEDGRGQVLR